MSIIKRSVHHLKPSQVKELKESNPIIHAQIRAITMTESMGIVDEWLPSGGVYKGVKDVSEGVKGESGGV